jgi:hypothetical protein
VEIGFSFLVITNLKDLRKQGKNKALILLFLESKAFYLHFMR